ncbi:hypothetical protein ACI2K4_09870 [Micromonospora sp. NPDC050397]|uniref:hypothetical protein n=1 Tax=Micromonospora sp. NPDC050397 TaxID=3364279 RepID=UPI00384D9D11
MSAETSDRSQVQRRADYLLPEERVVGSQDPLAQAEAILAESDRRTSDVPAQSDPSPRRRTSAESDPSWERRTSAETVTPTD